MRVDGERDDRDQAEHAVEDEQEERDDEEAGEARLQALVERLLAERGGDLRARDQLERSGSAPILRIFARSWALVIVKPPEIWAPLGRRCRPGSRGS